MKYANIEMDKKMIKVDANSCGAKVPEVVPDGQKKPSTSGRNYLEYCEARETLKKEVLIEKLMRKSSQTEKIPPSSLLAQVRTFLPQLKAANENLTDADKHHNIGMEEPASNNPYVDMDIAVYEDDEEDEDDS